jgi:DNA-binding Lrp family transcriptional regulator
VTEPFVSRSRIIEFIRKNPKQSTRQIATHFSLPYDHLWDRMRAMEEERYIERSTLGVEKKRGGTKPLIVWEVCKETLRSIYPRAMPHELREAFPGRSLLAIRKKAEGMKIKRAPGVVTAARSLSARLAALKRHPKEIADMVQTVVIRKAHEQDDSIVVKAIARRTPLEQAWSVR